MTNYIIDAGKPVATIHREIYGHFAEHLGRGIYQGIYVGEESPIPNENGMRRDVVEALRAIRVPVLRWPGGCFADEYHWMDGIGPKESRKRMINTHWGGVVEDNSFGTHEFFELCRQLGCMAYVNGNVGSGTVQEMSEWVEYMTFDGVSPMTALRARNGQEKPWRVDYFGVGNDNFAPERTMSRAMIATVLYRMERQPDTDAVAAFDDVEADKWYSEAVAWAAEAGIVEGYGANYGVNDDVTREQLVLMLWRMAGKPAAERVECGAHSWAADAMSWAISAGLIDGDAEELDVRGSATRADAAMILMRFINLF